MAALNKVLTAVTYTTSGEHYGAGPAAGKTWAVRDISVNYDGGGGPIEVAVFTRRGGSNWNIADRTNLGPNPDSIHWEGRRHMENGDVIGVYASANRNVHLWVSGTEFS